MPRSTARATAVFAAIVLMATAVSWIFPRAGRTPLGRLDEAYGFGSDTPIRTVAGNGYGSGGGDTIGGGYSGDGGPAWEAELNRPTGLTIDSGGNLYIADGLNGRIRKVSPAGIISTFAGAGDGGGFA